MTVALTGRLLRKEGTVEATVLTENGRIIQITEGECRSEDSDDHYHGLIIPGLVDMHTHTGDHGARGDLPPTLDKAVMPGGTKHKFLSSASRMEIVDSIRASLYEVRPGVTQIMDFREGGIQGREMLEEALDPDLPDVYCMARPVAGENGQELMDLSHGYGAPSVLEVNLDLWDYARKNGKLLSVHASELFREDIDDILSLRPHVLVHMVSGSEEDWKILSERKIPVIVCPRSNSAYGLPSVIPEMEGTGLDLLLGTDNSMTMLQDMFREMEAAWLQFRRNGMDGSDASLKVFSMAVGETGGEILWERLPPYTKWWEKGWPRKGDPAYLTVLSDENRCREDPFSRVVRFSGRNDVIFTGP
jgi:cytosine/adenosine deaminase-related metal-dependent hydrolase